MTQMGGDPFGGSGRRRSGRLGRDRHPKPEAPIGSTLCRLPALLLWSRNDEIVVTPSHVHAVGAGFCRPYGGGTRHGKAFSASRRPSSGKRSVPARLI